MRALTVRLPLSSVGQLAELPVESGEKPEPAPQSKLYLNPATVSAWDGSDGFVSERKIGSPSVTDSGRLKSAVGATFATSTVKVLKSEAPSLSVTVTVAVYVPLSS